MRAFIIVALIGLVSAAKPAQASFIETAYQNSDDVVITGSGTIDLSQLSSAGPSYLSTSGISSSDGDFLIAGNNDGYFGLAGPSSFGNGGITASSSQTGGGFAILANAGFLAVPQSYVSGTYFSNSLTFSGASFASLGLSNGTYTYSLGGSTTDFISLQVVGSAMPVPEPASLTIMILPVIGLLITRMRMTL